MLALAFASVGWLLGVEHEQARQIAKLKILFFGRHLLELDSVFQILGEHLHAMPPLSLRDCLRDMALPARFQGKRIWQRSDPE